MTAGAPCVGMLGLVVATPLLAAVPVVVRNVYIGDILGDPGAATAAEGDPNPE